MTTPNQPRSTPHRNLAYLLVTGFLLAVVVLGAVVLVVTSREDSASGIGPPPAAPPSTATASGCRPTDTRHDIPAAAPPDLRWTLYKTVALPYSASAGPFVVDSEVARCYAHAPLGALVAGPQIWWRAGASPGWRKVLAHQLTGTAAARNAYVSQCTGKCGKDIPAGTYGQFAGFKFIAYTPSTAVIEIVGRLPSGRMNAFPLTLVWEGDWKLQLQPDGISAGTARSITSLDGYVRWGGV
ncbi:hypothetical protein ACFY4C_41500 [Actinomadura viridis]|uniref:hypothetical protein n=1 Tax=Actinomadura viridis TaxID=58110 RepID=UPI0036CB2D21